MTRIPSLTVLGIRGSKIKVSGACGAFRREFVSLPFSAPRGHLHSLAPGPIASAPATIDLIFLPLSHKDPCDYVGPTWTM